MNLDCWNCAKTVGERPKQLKFRQSCPHCHADLHCCKNCRYHAPEKPNECLIGDTDYVRDREAANFCEAFALKDSHPTLFDNSAKANACRLLGGTEMEAEALFKKRSPLFNIGDDV